MTRAEQLILWLEGFMDAIPKEPTLEQWQQVEDRVRDEAEAIHNATNASERLSKTLLNDFTKVGGGGGLSG